MLRLVVVVRPFDEMIGQIETAVIIGAILEIDDDDFLRASIVPEYVALLKVIVTENDRRRNLGQVGPEKYEASGIIKEIITYLQNPSRIRQNPI